MIISLCIGQLTVPVGNKSEALIFKWNNNFASNHNPKPVNIALKFVVYMWNVFFEQHWRVNFNSATTSTMCRATATDWIRAILLGLPLSGDNISGVCWCGSSGVWKDNLPWRSTCRTYHSGKGARLKYKQIVYYTSYMFP